MKTTKLAASCFVIGLLLTPAAGYSGDKDGRHSNAGEFKDSAITTKIRAKMAADKHVSATDVNVNTDKDEVVVLSGTARSQSEINQAISISRSVDGVTKVINHIKL
ncbi:MAG: BON domain-containing protein [Pseudomonadota bacterium]|nr:BON domain-containing protein [Pseudomonadota bacterium]